MYLYREYETIHKAQDEWKQFIEDWKKDIYQKYPRLTLDFWYGDENHIGLKRTIDKSRSREHRKWRKQNDGETNNERRLN